MSAISQFGNRSLALGKNYSPEILAVVGVGGVITSGVLAARATLKLEPLVETLEHQRAAIHDEYALNNFDDKELSKRLFKAQSTFVLGLAKLYGPSVTLGAASVAALLGGQGILKKRNVALLGAYKSLESAYSEYRKRVIEEVGEEKEERIRLNLRAFDADETSGDDSDKPMALLTDEELKKRALGASPYAVFFDKYTSKDWSDNTDYNVTFLTIQQSVANDRLVSRGYLFLNEVLEALGMERTEAGQYVGWIYQDGERTEGDNYVDFGIDHGATVLKDKYQFEEDGSIMLDFNVDGTIIDKVWKKN
jgi:hypothetical protein